MDLFAIARERITCALAWLARSQDVTQCGGSSAYYAPLYGWAAPYPETSGYIIPTLLRGEAFLGQKEYAQRAEQMGRWLLSIQSPDGWFPGGKWQANQPGTPSVFNTGQILFGLVALAERSEDSAFRKAADRAASWLVRTQDADGRWTKDAYHAGYSPDYYAHVCWPLAAYYKRYGGSEIRTTIERALTIILSDRTPEGTFQRWSFFPGKPAVTHTIAYTLQGILESARLLDAWEQFGAPAADSCARLMRKREISGKLAGAYHLNWRPVSWYICLTGHCQLASAWMRVYEHTRDPRFLNVACKALEEACLRQRITPGSPNTHGALAGSHPFYGAYMRFRYPNWAAKFFVDAMMDAYGHLSRLQARENLCPVD